MGNSQQSGTGIKDAALNPQSTTAQHSEYQASPAGKGFFAEAYAEIDHRCRLELALLWQVIEVLEMEGVYETQ